MNPIQSNSIILVLRVQSATSSNKIYSEVACTSSHFIGAWARANMKSGIIIAADYRSIISFALHFHYISFARANIKGISGSIMAADCRSIISFALYFHYISFARANIKGISGSIMAADCRSIISFALHFHYISFARANIKGISGSIMAADCRSIVLYKMIIISLCTEQTRFNWQPVSMGFWLAFVMKF